jgi:GGDEF domain-containing protein
MLRLPGFDAELPGRLDNILVGHFLESFFSTSDSQPVPERIQTAMRTPFILDGREISSSMSVGISIFPLDAEDARSLLKNSDSAMYQSKRSGSGGYTFAARPDPDHRQ